MLRMTPQRTPALRASFLPLPRSLPSTFPSLRSREAAPARGPGDLSLLRGAARGYALRVSPQRALPGSRPPRDGAGGSGRRCLRTEQRARPCSRRSCSALGRRASEQPPGGGGVGLAGSLHPAGIRLPPLSDSASPSAGLQQTEDFAFIFPHLLPLLEEAFAPACLLGRAWQRWDDLLEVRESESKLEERLEKEQGWRQVPSRRTVAKCSLPAGLKLPAHDVPALAETRFRARPQQFT